MWPALVLDDSLVGERKGLNRNSGEKSVLVQFFGTHDFARCDIMIYMIIDYLCFVGNIVVIFSNTIVISFFSRVKRKQVISFLRGLLSSFHLKCKKPNFVRSLEEAKM